MTAEQKQWKVTWTIDEWAATPEEAAQKARAAQTRPGMIATVFEVREVVGPETATITHSIDVAELPRTPRLVPQRASCPECGSPVRHYFRANPLDPGDVDPAADCTNPSCDWGY